MSYQAFADCGPVEVNCQTHKISIQGQSSKIDCGRDTHKSGGGFDSTYDGTGTVGAPYVPPAPGDPIKNAVDVEGIAGMGKDSTGAVFHVPAGGEPKGGDTSGGCIHVNPAIFSKLQTCQGSPLTITGASGGAPAIPSLQPFQQYQDLRKPGGVK